MKLVGLAVAVAGDRFRVFLAQIQSVEKTAGSENTESGPVELIHSRKQAACVGISFELVETAQQSLAIVKPIQRHAVQFKIRFAFIIRLER